MDAKIRAQAGGMGRGGQETSGVKWRGGAAPFLIQELKVPNRAGHCSAGERGFPSRGFAMSHR
jgi:hypothetical protein